MSGRGDFGRSVLLYVGLGLAWATVARLFMRLFSDDPSFTLQGTGTIVGLVLLEFVGLGAVRGARLSGRTRWWRLAPVPGLMLYLSLGFVFLPCVVAGSVVGRCRRASVIGTVTLVGVAVSVAVPLALMVRESGIPMDLTTIAGVALYVACAVALVAASSEWSRRWRQPDRRTQPASKRLIEGNLAA